MTDDLPPFESWPVIERPYDGYAEAHDEPLYTPGEVLALFLIGVLIAGWLLLLAAGVYRVIEALVA